MAYVALYVYVSGGCLFKLEIRSVQNVGLGRIALFVQSGPFKLCLFNPSTALLGWRYSASREQARLAAWTFTLLKYHNNVSYTGDNPKTKPYVRVPPASQARQAAWEFRFID